ncbi:MAG: hypothetical protein INQ03_12185 [Candidatus Heimdallarchaeota archaeon]|nr:hypothetical protein [Candidatus Heimdallarchaeota archaeon]
MSILKKNEINTSLIWGKLRNLIDFNEISISEPFSIIGIQQGCFPIDSYQPIFLEVPPTPKSDISGRSNYNTNSDYYKTKWKTGRIVSLPIYKEGENLKLVELSNILHQWNKSYIPKEIPIISIATTIRGGYSSEGRIGQYSVVLIICPNRTARILELDWFEGPLEDCITPEWYIRTSELMTMLKAIERMREIHKIPPAWDKSVYSLFSIPSKISKSCKGNQDPSEYGVWGKGFSYNFFNDLQINLDKILNKLIEVY